MKKRKILAIIMIMCIIFTNINVYALNDTYNDDNYGLMNENEEFKTKDYIIKYKSDEKASNKKIRLLNNKRISSENVIDSELQQIKKIEFNEEKTLEEAKKAVNMNEIEYIQPDYEFSLESVDESQIVDTINSDNEKTKINNNNNEIVVAIIDSKVDLNNTKLKNNLWINENEKKNGEDSDNNGYIDDINGYSFVEFDKELNDFQKAQEENHATHIAGIISGYSNADDLGKRDNIKIMPLTVFKNGTAKTSDIISAIEYAKNNGAKIINASFGSDEINPALKEAIENCPDILFVCAAGNNHRNIDEKPVYPACYDLDNIISVTSINDDKGLSYYSNYGARNVDIAAKGKNIISTITDNKQGKKSGTSMAVAVISRSAALLISENKANSVNDIKEILIDTADKSSTLDGYVNKAASVNITDALNKDIKTKIENVNAVDEFSLASEIKTENEQMQLFSSNKTIDISCGNYHTLALKEDGTVWAWGRGTEGQLGNGTYKNSVIPVQVTGLKSIVEIKAGGYHSFARDSEGNLYSWGNNGYGQLGVGTSSRNIPALACEYKIKRERCFALGTNHTIIAPYDSEIYACGNNSAGQLGLGKYSSGNNSWSSVVDFENSDAHDVIYVEAKGDNSFAYTTEHYLSGQSDSTGRFQRELCAWGNIASSNKPVAMLGVSGTNKTYTNLGWSHGFFVNNSNDLRGIGSNEYGELGINTNEVDSLDSFKKLDVIDDVKEMACGFEYSLALKNNGDVYCWGVKLYEKGAIGNEDYDYNPKRLNISGIEKISSGMNFTVMLDNNGNVWSMGSGLYLGNGKNEYAEEPVKVAYIENEEPSGIKVKKMDIGETHSIAIKNDGTVWTWGDNTYGQLGNGTNNNSAIPVQVSGLSNITQVSAGCDYSLALTNDGIVYAWGKNNKGQLGNGTTENSNVPIKVNIPYPVKAISAGYDHGMLVTRDVQIDESDKKQAWTWGCNDKGQLGDGTFEDKTTPTQIKLTFVDTVSAGYKHSLMKKQDSTFYAWGDNTYGQLGDNRSQSQNCYPKNIKTGVSKISAGTNNSMILMSDGTVQVCGYNQNGELGLGNNTAQRLFVQVPGLSGIYNISAGNKNMYAISSGGTVFYFWGDKTYTSDIISSELNSNKEISTILYGSYEAVASNNSSQLILMKDGSLHSFGANEFGQLGNGGYADQVKIKEISWFDNPALYPAQGDGSAANPYIINNADEFNKVVNKLNAHYKLGCDIDFEGKSLTPIGSERNPFTGSFDGAEFSLSNFNINLSIKDNIGLFGYTNGATIKNIKLFSANISGKNNVGALIGYMNGGRVDNCSAYTVNVTSANGEKGLIGYTTAYENVTNVYFDANNWAVSEVDVNAGDFKAGEIKQLLLTAENVPMKKAIKFKVTYDWNNFDVVALGFDKNVTNGAIKIDNNIIIEKASGGELVFIVNDSDTNWSGVLVPIEFQAKNAGNLTFKFGIQGV